MRWRITLPAVACLAVACLPGVGGLAAGVQNNGQPEPVSTTLTHFILTGVPGPA